MIIGVILRTEQNDAQLAAAVIDILDPCADVQGDISDFVFVKLDMFLMVYHIGNVHSDVIDNR